MSVGLIVFAVALSSCDPYIDLPNNALGASLATDGQSIQIQYILCPRIEIIMVELVVNRKYDSVIGDNGDPVLWKITSSAGSTVQDFTVGGLPAGFVEAVPFTGAISTDDSLGILVDLTVGEAVVGFKLSDLRSDRVFSRGKSLTPSEFQEQAPKACH